MTIRFPAPLLSIALLALLPALGAADETPIESSHRAHAAVLSGQFVALETLIEDALRRVPGEVIDIELDDDEYEIEILDAQGVVWELDYNARTGAFMELERDD